jgi:hypothetical protein
MVETVPFLAFLETMPIFDSYNWSRRASLFFSASSVRLRSVASLVIYETAKSFLYVLKIGEGIIEAFISVPFFFNRKVSTTPCFTK